MNCTTAWASPVSMPRSTALVSWMASAFGSAPAASSSARSPAAAASRVTPFDQRGRRVASARPARARTASASSSCDAGERRGRLVPHQAVGELERRPGVGVPPVGEHREVPARSATSTIARLTRASTTGSSTTIVSRAAPSATRSSGAGAGTDNRGQHDLGRGPTAGRRPRPMRRTRVGASASRPRSPAARTRPAGGRGSRVRARRCAPGRDGRTGRSPRARPRHRRTCGRRRAHRRARVRPTTARRRRSMSLRAEYALPSLRSTSARSRVGAVQWRAAHS